MRVIVTGGRDFADRNSLFTCLNSLKTITMLRHGCAHGADTLADEYARLHNVPVDRHPASWDRYGRFAGPLRNQQMLEAGVDLLVACKGGRGTMDMLSRARSARIPIVKVAW